MKNKGNINKKQKVGVILLAFVLIIAITVIVIYGVKKIKGNDDYSNEPINENFSFLVDEPSSIIKDYNIFKDQDATTKEILTTYKKGKYTVDNPYIVVNPYLYSPQTALMLFKTDKKEKVTITIKGKHNDDLTVEFEASKDHYIPLYGLYGDYENQVVIKTDSGKTNTVKVKIDGHTSHGDITVLENKITNSNGEFYFGTTALGTASLAIDNYGEVRWFLSEDYSKGMVMLQNGHLLISDITEGPNSISTGGVIEVDMLGFIHNQYEIEGGYHHDAFEIKNGNLLITSGDNTSDYFCDVIYEIDRKTGQVLKTFDFSKIVKKVDASIIQTEEITWGFINSVFLDEERNELVVSLRNRNSVMAIDYETQEIKWILGDIKYWSNKFSKYLIKGSGSDFIYPGGQHSVIILDDGKLSIFNNNYNSFREQTVSCSTLKNRSSFGMIYDIDRDNKTATIAYKFGGEKYFSYALSSFNYTKDGNKLFNSGWHFSDESAYSDPTCTQFTNDKYNAYIVELDEKDNILVEILIDESKFEVIKAPIYNLEAVSITPKENKTISNYNFDDNASYKTNIESVKYETLTEQEALAYKENTNNPLEFFILNGRMTFRGFVLASSELKVTLISPKGIAYRYNIKETGADDYSPINLTALPKGRYYVYINLDDSIYNTQQYVEV
ncbi:MAG: aryl-sulfate sulfotransferase [Erysipelotrichales bacterium]|nr:aryl-sulfate sulfotransferase [Erysipelotrichales bacterium]